VPFFVQLRFTLWLAKNAATSQHAGYHCMKESTPPSGGAQGNLRFVDLAAIKALPPFPAVAARLLSVIADEDADFREVTQLIMTDTALSGQVLRLANSSIFGFREEVKSVLRALCLMGANRVRDMLITVALKGYIGAADGSPRAAIWRHSLATALWGEVIAQRYRLDKPMTYTAALLHDIGRIALVMLAPERSAMFFERVSESADRDLRPLEREMLGLDHCQVGGHLARLWHFQGALQDVIAHHHDAVAPDSPPARVLVQAACAAASMSGFHAAGRDRDWDPAYLETLLAPSPTGARPPLEEMRQKVSQELNLVECSLL